MAEIVKEYSNGEITVIWQPGICIHSENCFHSLPGVFNPNRRPWIDPQAASSEKIIQVVDNCPSKALSYRIDDAKKFEKSVVDDVAALEITIRENGPYLVQGKFVLKDADGNAVREGDKVALCRCGGSKNKPFCDGTHKEIGFAG